MTYTEILYNLCEYDSRHPDYDPQYTMPFDCYCNNCFMGRAVLVEGLLKYVKE